MIYFTSDLHFGHNNIIEYCNRPYSSANHMNEEMVRNWNSVVKPSDTIFILGDVFFMKEEETLKLVERLNGQKNLILGNHDTIVRKSELVRSQFRVLPDLYEESFDGINVVMCHYPLHSWNRARRGAFMLHGHVHSKIACEGQYRRYDVGVDAHNYTPVSWNKIKKTLSAIDPLDSRGR